MATQPTASPVICAAAGKLRAGVARADITNPDVLQPGVDVNAVQQSTGVTAAAAAAENPMYAKVLLLAGADNLITIGFVTLDVVSYGGGIGHIDDEFISRIRRRVRAELG
eukprot:SAG11_NODE_14630_length_605_cov_1.017787_1_plen_109_part_01